MLHCLPLLQNYNDRSCLKFILNMTLETTAYYQSMEPTSASNIRGLPRMGTFLAPTSTLASPCSTTSLGLTFLPGIWCGLRGPTTHVGRIYTGCSRYQKFVTCFTLVLTRSQWSSRWFGVTIHFLVLDVSTHHTHSPLVYLSICHSQKFG